MNRLLNLEEARERLRWAVERAGGPEEFARRHPKLSPEKIAGWIRDSGSMPSHVAFEQAGLKIRAMFETIKK
jgi:hypothetical protein